MQGNLIPFFNTTAENSNRSSIRAQNRASIKEPKVQADYMDNLENFCDKKATTSEDASLL
jgi:hypothetical protein